MNNLEIFDKEHMEELFLTELENVLIARNILFPKVSAAPQIKVDCKKR